MATTKGPLAHKTVTELRQLVDQRTHERELQAFLQKNPWLLVAEQIDPPFLIAQFPLGPDHRCDFAYFFRYSSGEYLKLIEIESPRLEIFNRSDEFTDHFNHALQQLEDWSSWCQRNPSSIASLLEPLFEQGFVHSLPGVTRIRLLLLAGRRTQILNARRRRRWQERINRLPANTEVRTWDGFIESIPLAKHAFNNIQSDVRCLAYSKQRYHVIDSAGPRTNHSHVLTAKSRGKANTASS